MTGELLLWYQIADRLGMSVRRCKKEVTSREFLGWKHYLQRVHDQTTPDQYYLAQIALQVRRSFSTKPDNHKLEHFVLESKKPEPEIVEDAIDDAVIEKRTATSKLTWGAVVGVRMV